MVWLEEDASLRYSSSSPFSARIKRKSHKTTKYCGRKNSRGKEKMVDDEPLGRKLLKTSRKGKEKMDEFLDSTPIKERKYSDDRVDDEAVGRNSIRTRRKGKEIMAEFSDVGVVEDELNLLNKKDPGKKPVRSATDVHESNVK
nr:hypothetical protein [Tanacetum cinerariifolium]